MDSIPFPRINALKGPILITGHTGFKGAWLTLLLEFLGLSVVGISHEAENNSLFSKMNRRGKIVEIFEDLQNYQKIENFVKEHEPSIVFHLAAQSIVSESYRDPVRTFSTNVMGTASILDASCKINSVQTILVATTDKVYENNDLGRKFTESDPLGGKDPYSASKVGTEMVVKAWRSVQSERGKPKILVARAGNVIGGGDYAQNRIFPDLVRAITANQPLEIRNPFSTRPWQHVLDPIFGYLKFVESSLGGLKTDSLNFGPDGDEVTVAQLLNIAKGILPIESLMEKEVKEIFKEAKYLSLDSSRAKKELTWSPKYSQVEAIQATAKWWASYLAGEANALSLCRKEIEQFLEK